MSKLPTCPPIVPPAFEPSAAARDELARAERAHREASEAVSLAEGGARSTKAETEAAQRAFGEQDTDERWRALEDARRRETSAQLRAERCTTELADAERALQAARATAQAERRAFLIEQASPAVIARIATPALVDLARGVALLIRAAQRMEPLRRLNAAAFNALSQEDAERSAWREGAVELAFRAASGLAQVECGAAVMLASTGSTSMNGNMLPLAQLLNGSNPDQLPPDVAAMLRDELARLEHP